MLGPPKPRRLDEPIAVSLEDLVPPDHFYRQLERSLDLGFVRDWARDRHAERGRPGIGYLHGYASLPIYTGTDRDRAAAGRSSVLTNRLLIYPPEARPKPAHHTSTRKASGWFAQARSSVHIASSRSGSAHPCSRTVR